MKHRRSRTVRILGSTIGLLGLVCLGCSDASPNRVLGSEEVVGNGVVVEENRVVGAVSGVDLAGIGSLYIDQGGAPGLRIRAEENLIPYLETENRGGVLVIRQRRGYDLEPTTDIGLYLTVADLRSLALTGAGGIRVSGLDGGDLSIELTGVGNIDVSNLNVARLTVHGSGVGEVRIGGTTQDQQIVLDGLGSCDARNLQSAVAQVTLRSRGSATVRVSERLAAAIHGSGSVYYIGSPAVTRTGNGSGSVVSIGG